MESRRIVRRSRLSCVTTTNKESLRAATLLKMSSFPHSWKHNFPYGSCTEMMMKLIGLEEHYATPEMVRAWLNLPSEQQDLAIPRSTGKDKEKLLIDLADARPWTRQASDTIDGKRKRGASK